MNADRLYTVGRIPLRTPLNAIQHRSFFFVILFVLQIGLVVSAVVSARADFSDPYALNPPDPGDYLVLAPGQQSFGSWTALPSGRALRVNTLSGPGSLTLDTEPVNRPAGGYFFARAAASGTVSFDYTIAGQGTGSLSWFNSGPVFNFPTPPGAISDLVSTPTVGSIAVQAGDIFGFEVLAMGVLGGETAERSVTIGNFAAPVPEPSTVTLMGCVVALLARKVWSRRRNSSS